MSLTFTGFFIGALVYLANHLGLPFTEAELSTTVEVIGGFFSLALVYWGRFRQGDMSWFGTKE